MNRRALFAAVAIAALFVPALASAAVEKYKIDPVHSDVGFTVRHIMSRVPGRFNQFEGDIQIDPKDPTTLSFTGKIQATSIDTRNERRDGDLRSPNFFDAATYPEITFVSKKTVQDGDHLKATGDLTMRGVTKEITLDVEVLGFLGEKAGFEASGKINRKDFGIVWNRNLDQGGTLLSDDVDLLIRIEAQRDKGEQPQK